MHTALPLTQQIQAWLLQSMGYLDDLTEVSRSTAKSALRGSVIDRSWEALTRESLVALQLSVSAEQLAGLQQQLRALDQRIAHLNDLDLPRADRLPVVLQLLLPQLGLRLGALAAAADRGLGPDALRTDPSILDRLCEPLSPRGFGWVVEALLRHHRPDWTTWKQRDAVLSAKGVASKKTMERWRSLQLCEPNLNNLSALVGFMGDEAEQRRASFLLRLGRAQAIFRKKLSAWVGDTMAEAAEQLVSAWARCARHHLTQTPALQAIAEVLADALESEHGEALLAARTIWWGPQSDPGAIAAQLREAGKVPADAPLPDLLTLLLIEQMLQPSPVLFAAVARSLGAPGLAPAVLVMDPFAQIQHGWEATRLLKHIADGQPIKQPGSAGPIPDESLRAQARQLLAAQRRLIRAPDDEPPPDPAEVQVFFARIAAQAGGQDGLKAMVEHWNAAAALQALPAALEPMVSDEVIAENLHLAPHRAKRLQEAGRSEEAMRWLKAWMAAPATKAPRECTAAAETTLSLAEQRIQRTLKLRNQVVTLQESMEALLTAYEKTMCTLSKRLASSEKLYRAAQGLLAVPANASMRADHALRLLPMALRLDSFRGELSDDEIIEIQHTEPLIEVCKAALEAHPAHAGSWAALAAWQLLLEEDASYAIRQARHHGGETIFERLCAVLREEDLLD